MSNKYFTTFLFILFLPLYISAQDNPFNVALGDTGWFQQNSGTTRHLYDVFFANDTTGIAISQGGRIIKTTNAGELWYQVFSDDTLSLSSVFFIDDLTGWVSTGHTHILKSTDGGESWSIVVTSTTGSFFDIFFINEQKGWLVAKASDIGPAFNAKIYRTNDGGSSWVLQYSDTLTSAIFNIIFLNDTLGWAVGNYDRGGDAIILHTKNGGNYWYIQEDDFPGWLYDIHFQDDSAGWAVGRNGLIVKTTNGGAIWEQVNHGGDESLESLFFTNNYTGWIVGNDPEGKILKTTDAGETWYYQFANVPFSATTVNFVNDFYGWIVGFQGKILHTETGGEPVTQVSETSSQIFDFKLEQNYPNPFNPRTVIRYTIPKSNFASLKVYDVIGNEVATLINEELAAGDYEVDFNAEGLTSGVYFYQLKAGSFIETKKMLLIK